ncbi:MAG TPA: fasciclin domain-containing protein [Bacteroidetes bacterium]|nr:fasciclin domain-containing protein [Bacteroidota bacterium]
MKILHLITASLFAFAFFACQQSAPEANTAANGSAASDAGHKKGQADVQDPSSKKNILQIAIGSKDHTTLVAAVQAAELENVLVNAGPLTVFAPTNEAFAALPDGTVDNLLKPENKKLLARLIKFHAAPGKYTKALLKDGQRLFMASGHYVNVEKKGDDIYVDGGKIIGTVEASNGLVHVVDKVMLLPELKK